MKTYIYGGHAGHYKANLHSHSTVSDGKKTPEEMKNFYKEHGYSVLSLTDHNILKCHKDLSDPDFLMLTGYEVDMNEPCDKDFSFCRTVHMNAYPPEAEEERHVLFASSDLDWMKPIHPECDYSGITYHGEQYKRHYGIEDINKFISECHRHGYMVTLNHPVWSGNEPEEFKDIDGDLFAIEIINGGCYEGGYCDNTTVYWDYLLRRGKHIFCTATDDNHNVRPYGSGRCDSFIGFDVINAPSLGYKDVIEALKSGNFYASDGAYIDEVYYEDGRLTVKCPGARRVEMITGRRRRGVAVQTAEGRPITEATFEVKPEDIYIRVEVEDQHGKRAYSQALFL